MIRFTQVRNGDLIEFRSNWGDVRMEARPDAFREICDWCDERFGTVIFIDNELDIDDWSDTDARCFFEFRGEYFVFKDENDAFDFKMRWV